MFRASDLVFEDNTASFGGGLYIGNEHDNVVVTRCIFERGSSDFGGGVYVSGGIIYIVVDKQIP